MLVKACILFAFLGLISAEECKNPQLSSQSFSTLDGTVLTHIGYVVKFSLSCDNTVDIPLYAELNGIPLAVSKPSSGGYLIGWSEEVKKAPKGEIKINLFDEENYSAYRKAQRGGDVSSFQPTAVLSVHHPGSYTGPWINAELAATVLSLAVLYVAVNSRMKISS